MTIALAPKNCMNICNRVNEVCRRATPARLVTGQALDEASIHPENPPQQLKRSDFPDQFKH